MDDIWGTKDKSFQYNLTDNTITKGFSVPIKFLTPAGMRAQILYGMYHRQIYVYDE